MKALVNIDVDDLEKAIAFYTSAFGVTVGRRFAGQPAELVGGSVPVYLLLKAAGTSPSPATSQLRSYERHWTPVHLDQVVDDVEAAVVYWASFHSLGVYISKMREFPQKAHHIKCCRY